jgi:hypothetical protein
MTPAKSTHDCSLVPTQCADSNLSPEEQALVKELVADGLSIQERFKPEATYQRTGKGAYESQTVEEIERAKSLKEKGTPP